MMAAVQANVETATGLGDAGISEYLADCRKLVLAEIGAIIPADAVQRRTLYALMLEYPLREAKALRPALCMATCRSLGGSQAAILRTAAVLELYHNAFLIHDDIEDASLMRRGGPTLHHAHGVPIAINVGDAMFALSLRPLLDNTAVLGLGKALRILEAVARMVQESVEGQALELDWVRNQVWTLSDDDYVDMVTKKTGWYSFITPVLIGCIAADAPPAVVTALETYARCLGVAFQIQDDLLNLEEDIGGYGKERHGDLWEGKRTLMLLHALREASPAERSEALRILGKPRPADSDEPGLATLLAALVARGDLHERGAQAIQDHLAGARGAEPKLEVEVDWLFDLLTRHGSLAHARQIAARWAMEARRALTECETLLIPSVHRDLLGGLARYVLDRLR
jgi:geranylgeranyl diphosphate synthase type II